MAKFHQTTLPGGSADPNPTSYEVTAVTLYSNSGVEWNIKEIVAKIEIYESLYTASIEATLGIADAVTFLEQAKITGNEKIILKVQQARSEQGDEVKRKFELELYIAEVMNYSRVQQGMQVYEFVCFSKHMYNNSFSRINRYFKGTIGNLVKTIVERDLEIEPHFINTSSKGIIEGIYPRMRPITAINWLMRNAFEDNTPYYFYETAFNGVNFNSYKNLLTQELYRTYNYRPSFRKPQQSPDSYEEIVSRIRSFSSQFNMSKLASISEGAYASTIHELDIAKKKYSVSQTGYDQVKQTLNQFKPFSEEPKFKDKAFKDAYESLHYFVSTNSNVRNYHSVLNPSLNTRQSYLENIDLMTETLEIAGDFELTCGKIIGLDIPRASDVAALDLEGKDKVLSGNYLVTSIVHRFGESEYTMNVVCQKDSFIMDLEGSDDE